MMFVFQYSSQSLVFNEIMDRLLDRFLNLVLKSFFVFISESQDVSCWGCNANSTSACLQRQVAKLACRLFYCWVLLRNSNMATNLHVFTLRFAACKCWTQVIATFSHTFVAYCAKRSIINLQNPLSVWDWTLVRFIWMSVHCEKVSKDKQGFIEKGVWLHWARS